MNDVFTPASIIVLHERLNDLGPLLWAIVEPRAYHTIQYLGL
jgi:hypothetical protein